MKVNTENREAWLHCTDGCDRNAGIAARMLERMRQAGARIVFAPTTNSISFLGVRATCTWSTDHGLLAAWRNACTRRIAKDRGA